MEGLLGTLTYGKLFVISAPAGTGKTTLMRMIRAEFPTIAESVSCTTRPKRPGEIDGVDYIFLSHDEFKAKIGKGEFLEHAEVFSELYGTLFTEVESKRLAGKHVVLVIDTQGAFKIKRQIHDAILIFISPPSMEELKKRLERRGTEVKEKLEERLTWANIELGLRYQYEYHIINENLSLAYEILKSIFIAEAHRMPKGPDITTTR